MIHWDEEYGDYAGIDDHLRRERACSRARMVDQAIRWGGWLLAGLILMANLAARVC